MIEVSCCYCYYCYFFVVVIVIVVIVVVIVVDSVANVGEASPQESHQQGLEQERTVSYPSSVCHAQATPILL